MESGSQNKREVGGGGQEAYGFSEMWAGVQKEVELNHRTK